LKYTGLKVTRILSIREIKTDENLEVKFPNERADGENDVDSLYEEGIAYSYSKDRIQDFGSK